eukprot:TRINITY_DN3605_c0_g1_i1.p1 TRINITY_DN3605_c0_g1~~TRINITY_DN3605_c0_g1_i1.p1  ORF type:complete len:438 (+),score=60.94 TRINITY_DN3605_c0_g1_i1:32-1345(+)
MEIQHDYHFSCPTYQLKVLTIDSSDLNTMILSFYLRNLNMYLDPSNNNQLIVQFPNHESIIQFYQECAGVLEQSKIVLLPRHWDNIGVNFNSTHGFSEYISIGSNVYGLKQTYPLMSVVPPMSPSPPAHQSTPPTIQITCDTNYAIPPVTMIDFVGALKKDFREYYDVWGLEMSYILCKPTLILHNSRVITSNLVDRMSLSLGLNPNEKHNLRILLYELSSDDSIEISKLQSFLYRFVGSFSLKNLKERINKFLYDFGKYYVGDVEGLQIQEYLSHESIPPGSCLVRNSSGLKDALGVISSFVLVVKNDSRIHNFRIYLANEGLNVINNNNQIKRIASVTSWINDELRTQLPSIIPHDTNKGFKEVEAPASPRNMELETPPGYTNIFSLQTKNNNNNNNNNSNNNNNYNNFNLFPNQLEFYNYMDNASYDIETSVDI